MKTLTLCFLCIIFCKFYVNSQIPAISWEKDLVVKVPHYFTDVQELSGGNFILLGAIEQPGEWNSDIWLLEIANNGDTIKTKIFKNMGKDIPMRILLNGENGYLVAYVNETGDKVFKSSLMAVGTDFTALWKADAEQPPSHVHADIAVDNNGNIWWLNTVSAQNKKTEVILSKLDLEGKKILEFKFSDNNPVEGYAIRALPDGTMSICCRILPPIEKPFIQVVKIDQEGIMLWKTAISDANKHLTPQCLCCSPDNTLLAGGWAGLCYNPDASADEQIWDYDYLLSKIDPSGRVLWTQNFNREGSEKATSVAVLPDGNILAAGKCETSFSGNIGPWLLFIDQNGNRINDQVYKFKFVKDQIARIICTKDGGILMVGPGYVETQHQLTGWLRKLNPEL